MTTYTIDELISIVEKRVAHDCLLWDRGDHYKTQWDYVSGAFNIHAFLPFNKQSEYTAADVDAVEGAVWKLIYTPPKVIDNPLPFEELGD